MFPRQLIPACYHTPKAQQGLPNPKNYLRRNKRVAAMIDAYDGQLVRYADLPHEAQLAMAQYMAIDGEAWQAPEAVYEAFGKAFKYSHTSKKWREIQAAAHQMFIDSLPLMVQKYGSIEFGYIAALPMKVLIESVMKDADMKKDYAGLEGWKQYHDWYMGTGTKHEAPSDLWPVILSSFDDETLQDGWTRFHQYAERHLLTCPALFYPHRNRNSQQAKAEAKIEN
jgi:hypothetical protein